MSGYYTEDPKHKELKAIYEAMDLDDRFARQAAAEKAAWMNMDPKEVAIKVLSRFNKADAVEKILSGKLAPGHFIYKLMKGYAFDFAGTPREILFKVLTQNVSKEDLISQMVQTAKKEGDYAGNTDGSYDLRGYVLDIAKVYNLPLHLLQ